MKWFWRQLCCSLHKSFILSPYHIPREKEIYVEIRQLSQFDWRWPHLPRSLFSWGDPATKTNKIQDLLSLIRHQRCSTKFSNPLTFWFRTGEKGSVRSKWKWCSTHIENRGERQGEKREEMRNLGLEDSRQWEAAANVSYGEWITTLQKG